MKKGDQYKGKKSGLCLKIKDSNAKGITIEVERRIISRKTGEIQIETREREVPKDLIPYLLLGYEVC